MMEVSENEGAGVSPFPTRFKKAIPGHPNTGFTILQ